MTEQKIIIIAVVAAAIIVCTAVVYVYRDKVKKALAEPGQTLLCLADEWEAFLADEQTRNMIAILCRMADKLVGGTGEDRLAFVCGKLYELVPDWLQPVITIEKLKKAVNLIYDEIKVYIDGHWVAGE